MVFLQARTYGVPCYEVNRESGYLIIALVSGYIIVLKHRIDVALKEAGLLQQVYDPVITAGTKKPPAEREACTNQNTLTIKPYPMMM